MWLSQAAITQMDLPVWALRIGPAYLDQTQLDIVLMGPLCGEPAPTVTFCQGCMPVALCGSILWNLSWESHIPRLHWAQWKLNLGWSRSMALKFGEWRWWCEVASDRNSSLSGIILPSVPLYSGLMLGGIAQSSVKCPESDSSIVLDNRSCVLFR